MVIGGMSAVIWRSLEAQSHTGRWWHRHAGRFAASGVPAVVPGAVGSESARMVALSRSVSRLSPCHARCTCISPRRSSRFNMRALMPHCFAACAMCIRFSRGGSSPSLPSHTRSYQMIHDHLRPYTASHTTPAGAPRLAHDVGVGIGQHPGRAASPASVPALYRPPAPGHVSRREGGCWYGASPKAPRTSSQTPHPSPRVTMLRVPWPGTA